VGRILVSVIGAHSGAESEAGLVAALAEVAGEHDVIRASAERESEAASLRERLATMPLCTRAAAVEEFARRYGSSGRDDARRLRRYVGRLEAEEAADVLLVSFPELTLEERLARINEYAIRYPGQLALVAENPTKP
jgi:hypothetical protein